MKNQIIKVVSLIKELSTHKPGRSLPTARSLCRWRGCADILGSVVNGAVGAADAGKEAISQHY